MKLFRRRSDRVLDLTKRYEKQQARAEEIRSDELESSNSSGNAGGFGFFGAIANTVSQNNSNTNSSSDERENSEYVDISSGIDDKKRKLAKRLIDMTNKIEELSNQIYHLQQRIEVLEKRSGISGY